MEIARKIKSGRPTSLEFSPGQQVGRYTLISLVGRKNGHLVWRCSCECGTVIERTRGAIMRSKPGMCQRGHATNVRVAAGDLTLASSTAEYNIWLHIRGRCLKSTNAAYRYYGGRGIKMCERWQESFLAFFEDMGPRPSDQHSIDRINNDGDYEPSNCRWTTKKRQARNTRRTCRVEFDGRTLALQDWCEMLGVNFKTVYNRMFRFGWTFVDAVTLPTDRSRDAHGVFIKRTF